MEVDVVRSFKDQSSSDGHCQPQTLRLERRDFSDQLCQSSNFIKSGKIKEQSEPTSHEIYDDSSVSLETRDNVGARRLEHRVAFDHRHRESVPVHRRLVTNGVQSGAVEMNRRQWRLANVRVPKNIQVQLGDAIRRRSVWNVKIPPMNIILMQSVVSVRVKDTEKFEKVWSLTI